MVGGKNIGSLEAEATKAKIVWHIIAYSLCSSTLLLANKVAMSYLPKPALVSVLQLLFATVTILLMKGGGVKVDDLEWAKVKPYMVYILAFVGSIFANMNALNRSNVETIIVFRASTPMATTVIDYMFLGRELPTLRSAAALGVVGFGALVYCMSDSQLGLDGIGAYTWVSVYFVLIVFEMTYGKKLVKSVEMKSVWGPVLYTNLIAILPMTIMGLCFGEINGDSADLLVELDFAGWCVLLFSCITGCLIGYCGWSCRALLSATTYTLVGVVNKFLTILLNVLLWDKHSTPFGLMSVCLCLAGGFFYQQAPLRAELLHEASPGDKLQSDDSDVALAVVEEDP